MAQKTVFISGATSGIGLATAKRLFADGWKVYAGGMQGDDFLKLDYGITQLPFDITDADGVAGAVKLLSLEIEQLDALVNNAGIQIPGPLEALPVETIQRQFDVNVTGHLRVTKAMLPLLRKSDSGRIVNVSSLMGQVPLPMFGAYSMSKHALEAMSDVLRLELKPAGIHVSVVAPGAIKTPMSQQSADDLKQLRDESPPEIQAAYAPFFKGMLKTLESQQATATEPEKIAGIIVEALTSKSPKARYVTGLDVAGLSTIRRILPGSLWDMFLLRVLGIK